ncbi:MAG: thioredoxin [Capnocytophaga felis]|nr:thioredoxin [Capnocytophaga felis]
MMNRLLLLLLLPSFLISCKNIKDENRAFLKGFFPNAKDSLVVLYHNNKPVDTVFFNENKKFSLNLEISEAKLYHFEIDNNYQYVFLEPKDSLIISANALNFHQTISFSGRGSAINSFVSQQINDYEKENLTLKKFNLLQPDSYKKKMDSVYNAKIQMYDALLKDNPKLSEKAKNIALVSATFPLYKEIETYAFVFQKDNRNPVTSFLLPKNFYEHRKKINFNDNFLEYFRPYYGYMVMFTNNLALKKLGLKSGRTDVNREEDFHLKKIKVIDSIFPSGSMRDNLYRNAAYSYVFNIQHNGECQCYVDEFNKYNENNIHKSELESFFKSTIALQTGSIPPDFEIIDLEKNRKSLSKIVKPEITVYYFWSVNQPEMSSLIFNRVLQLRTLFPETQFTGIDVGQNVDEWLKKAPSVQGIEQFHAIDFTDLSRKFLINNISQTFILGRDARIITAFEGIFSPNIEKILLNN